jgi:hypothetical protein
MSTPDYPLLTVPGYELYQLAHLTTVAVDALARRRRRVEQRDRLARLVAGTSGIVSEAVDARPAQVSASVGGFAAARTALPRPGATPSSGVARSPGDGVATRLAPSAGLRQVSPRRSTPVR